MWGVEFCRLEVKGQALVQRGVATRESAYRAATWGTFGRAKRQVKPSPEVCKAPSPGSVEGASDSACHTHGCGNDLSARNRAHRTLEVQLSELHAQGGPRRRALERDFGSTLG